MAKSKTIRSPILILLGFFIVALLSISGPPGQAAAGPAGDRNSVENTSYIPPAPSGSMDTNQNQTNCRYGTAAGYYTTPTEWIDYFGAGNYMNFGAKSKPLPEGVELLRLVDVQQEKANGRYLPSYTVSYPLRMDRGLGPIVQANLGNMWIVGNESDVSYNDRTGMYPEMYARAYHEIYHFIKGVDPTAQVAITGLSMQTPGRLQYLDIVWETYLREFGEPMPVDVWTTHLYILSEIRPWDGKSSDGQIALGTDPDLALEAPGGSYDTRCPLDNVICRSEHDDVSIFIEQIVALRSWMKDHGQQNKPLLLTEFSQLYVAKRKDEFGENFSEQRVSTYLAKTLDFLETAKDPNLGYPADDNRLVQQWTWYSLYTDPSYSGGSSNLLVNGFENYPVASEDALTQVGLTFRNRAKSSEAAINLVAAQALDVQAKLAGETADVELKVGFYNNGSIGIADPFKITFYKDSDLTQVIGETKIMPKTTGIINGCSWGRITEWASVTWNDVPAGSHPFWVKIDSGNQVEGETNKSDNLAKGSVIVSADGAYFLDVEVVSENGEHGGIVSREPDHKVYIAGQTVTLTATPFSGWRFAGWTGDVTTLDRVFDLTIDSNKTIQANFSRISYQINTAITGKGSVKVTPQKDNYYYGDKVILNAVPAPSWRFSSWNGNIATSGPQTNLTVKQNEDIIANFVQLLPEVTDQAYFPVHAAP